MLYLKLVNYSYKYTEMHGQQNVKISYTCFLCLSKCRPCVWKQVLEFFQNKDICETDNVGKCQRSSHEVAPSGCEGILSVIRCLMLTMNGSALSASCISHISSLEKTPRNTLMGGRMGPRTVVNAFKYRKHSCPF